MEITWWEGFIGFIKEPAQFSHRRWIHTSSRQVWLRNRRTTLLETRPISAALYPASRAKNLEINPALRLDKAGQDISHNLISASSSTMLETFSCNCELVDLFKRSSICSAQSEFNVIGGLWSLVSVMFEYHVWQYLLPKYDILTPSTTNDVPSAFVVGFSHTLLISSLD